MPSRWTSSSLEQVIFIPEPTTVSVSIISLKTSRCSNRECGRRGRRSASATAGARAGGQGSGTKELRPHPPSSGAAHVHSSTDLLDARRQLLHQVVHRA